jgi:hypothetical protein
MGRHKCFISYHRVDEEAVLAFKDQFDDAEDAFIFRGQSMPEDLINSSDDEYVIGEIRRRFLADSSVTIVLVGRCTWSRKFVDWEVQASLRQPAGGLPNGLLAIVLDQLQRSNPAPTLPERVKSNVESGYARYHWYPSNGDELTGWVDDAYAARTGSAALIQNPRGRQGSDAWCT